MLERISEPISNLFVKEINTTSALTVIDFQDETNNYKNNLVGDNYNFNYNVEFLTVSYKLPSLTEKPFQEYNLTDTEADRRAADIEFGRKYNEIEVDGKRYAIRLSLKIQVLSVTQTIGEVLLYNSLARLDLPLIQYLGTTTMNEFCQLKVQLSHYTGGDEIIVSSSYKGNVNYTFDTGSQSHVFP